MNNDNASDYAQEPNEQTDSNLSQGSQQPQQRPLDPLIVSMFVTSGTIPPPVAGASLTVIGDRLWVFGGRLVSNRRMTSELYSLHMETFVWRKHNNLPGDPAPEARYFHSADQYAPDRLVVFGGMGQRLLSETSNNSNGHDTSVVLSDVTVLDVSNPDNPRWRRPRISGPIPRARYAHLTAINGHQLVVIGGQDLQNTYVEDVHTLDLDTFTWTQASPFPKHCGVYRSIALCYAGSTYVYSNYNFTDVRRELQVLGPDLHLTDRSRGMTGENRPPGLRFPTGHLIGDHLVVSGTYLTNTSQTFSTWLLDMRRLVWARLECSRPLHKGSWNRAVLDARRNRHLILGNRERTLLVDYEHRRVNFEHVAAVCLESYGVYDVPRQRISVLGQELGGILLNRRQFADFEIRVSADANDLSDDEDNDSNSNNNSHNSNSAEHRSPNGNEERRRTSEHSISNDTASMINGPRGSIDELSNGSDNRRNSEITLVTNRSSSYSLQNTNRHVGLDNTPLLRGERVILVNTALLRQRWPHFDRLVRSNTKENQQRFLRLPEPYSVIRHLLHYLYTGALDPSSSVDVLGELMVLGDVYDLKEMLSQAAHVLHGRLTLDTAPHIFRYATLAHRNGLRVRALRIMRRNADVLARSVALWQLPDAIRNDVIAFLPPNFPRTPPASVAAVLAGSQAPSTRQNTPRPTPPSVSERAVDAATTAVASTMLPMTSTTAASTTTTIAEENEPGHNGNNNYNNNSISNSNNNNSNLSTTTRTINGWSFNDSISTNGYIVNGIHTRPERPLHSNHPSISGTSTFSVDSANSRRWMHRPSAVGLSAIESHQHQHGGGAAQQRQLSSLHYIPGTTTTNHNNSTATAQQQQATTYARQHMRAASTSTTTMHR
ncbi:hypothetical protein BDF19DRAFT_415535 [Syncephalis fuscata]|nr:hypothetical protein BDF19DRAFT_415535 [Syncephalis fuscata]